MKRIVAPTETGADWKRLLAKPDLHWKPGKSAMSAAACWEAAGNRLPPEVSAALTASRDPDLASLELLLAEPEWKTALPGGKTASHTDVLALTRNDRGLVAVAVEAKADEVFGPTLREKRRAPSRGQAKRLDYLHQVLQLDNPLPDAIPLSIDSSHSICDPGSPPVSCRTDGVPLTVEGGGSGESPC